MNCVVDADDGTLNRFALDRARSVLSSGLPIRTLSAGVIFSIAEACKTCIFGHTPYPDDVVPIHACLGRSARTLNVEVLRAALGVIRYYH